MFLKYFQFPERGKRNRDKFLANVIIKLPERYQKIEEWDNIINSEKISFVFIWETKQTSFLRIEDFLECKCEGEVRIV